MHYAVPRILQEAGMLDRFFTDICAVKGWPRLLSRVPYRYCSQPLRRFLGRTVAGVPPEKIVAFAGFGLAYSFKLARAHGLSQQWITFLKAGRDFGFRVTSRGFGDADGVYAFNTAGLEILQSAKGQGLTTILEQTIAPAEFERSLLEAESRLFPDWQIPTASASVCREFAARERAEWDLADRIVCGSEFVLQAIRAVGGPYQRCVVVPYGVDSPACAREPRSPGRLRVLFVGTIGLRKGAHYVGAVAERLGAIADFRLLGPTGLVRPEQLQKLSNVADVVGTVPRAQMWAHYRWADVVLFPTLCEGSATVCYEALAAGLPVITTPNAGSVVRNGVEGFIVAPRDVGAMTAAIEVLSRDFELLAEFSRRARARARDFTVARYGERLVSALCQSTSPVIAALPTC